MKRLQREKLELRAKIDTNEKDLDHYDSIQNQIKDVERENERLMGAYEAETERVSAQKATIHKTYVESGKEQKIESLQNLIQTVKDHAK